MTCRLRVRYGALAFLLVAPGVVARAQSEALNIPVALANALLGGSRNEAGIDYHFVVEALPTGWPEALVPAPPARPIGGINGGVEMVAVFSDTARRFLQNYLRQVESAGWAPPPSPPMNGFQPYGFQPSDNFGRNGLFCRDSAGITAVAVPGATVGAFVRVTYRFREPGCIRQLFLQSEVPKPLAIPILTAPSTSRSQGGGSSGGGDNTGMRTRLMDSTLTAEMVVAHYTKQLVSAGWKATDAASRGRVATQVFDATDGSNLPWSGVLSVVTTGAFRDVSLTMWRKRPE